MMKARLSCVLFVLFLLSALAGQEIIFERYAEGVDFWVMMPYNTLIFKKSADIARYQVTVEIKNLGTKKVVNFEQSIDVPRRDWLKDTAILASFRKEIEPGKYQALLRLKNVNLGDKTDLKKIFTVGEKYTEIGQPYFIVTREGIDYLPSDFRKLGVPVQRCVIQHKFSVSVDSLQVRIDGKYLSYPRPKGQNIADLTEIVNSGSVKDIGITLFEGNIQYQMAAFLYDQWFSYNVRYDYKDQIQQLRYIANQNEWKSIRAVPEDVFPEVIERFWQVHDPSPGTIRNEARESFYQRVILADERYTIHKRLKGWSSDRGRIYIKYGDPDEVHSEVHPIDLYPYIIWLYYNENLEFEFADTGGFGQYKLRNKDEEY